VSHRNLVSLIGYCHEDNQKMLIYEFMHKGSLRDHLYGDLAMLTVEKLDWKSRMNIVLNAAQGILQHDIYHQKVMYMVLVLCFWK
jgi:hypothetical protein